MVQSKEEPFPHIFILELVPNHSLNDLRASFKVTLSLFSSASYFTSGSCSDHHCSVSLSICKPAFIQESILIRLVEHYGWDDLSSIIQINCFTNNPSIKSSLTFLRKTPWARKKVEDLYLHLVD